MHSKNLSVILFAFYLILFLVNKNNSCAAIIEGKLLGANSAPMILSHVEFSSLIHYDTLSVLYECDKNGNFKIETQDTGFVFLRFSGVNHKSFRFPLYISDLNENIQLECQLKSNCIDTSEKIYVVGNFNQNRFYDTNYVMEKNADGTFSININYPKDTLIYQILSKDCNDNHSVNGTFATYYQRDDEGDYFSIYVDKNPNKYITLDPTIFGNPHQQDQSRSIKILNNPTLQQFVDLCTKLKMELKFNERSAYFLRDSTLKNEEILSTLAGNKIGKNLQRRLDTLDSAISHANNYPSRMILYMEFLNYASTAQLLTDAKILGLISIISVDINVARVKEGLNIIPPLSPLWVGFANGPEIPFFCSIIADGLDSSSYFDELVNSYPVRYFRKEALRQAFNYYDELDINKPRKLNLLGKLLTDYPNDEDVKDIKRRYSPKNKIVVGKQIPKFEILDIDTGALITKKDILGKYTLIDFWSTSCGPCIQEFPFITDAYNKYKNSNFQVIMISFDTDINKVSAFRSKRYDMPWINALEKEGFASDIAKKFEVIGIPRPILIGPDGTILAIENSLRMGKLNKTLEMYLK